MDDDPQTLVSTDWLAARLGDARLRLLDATWVMPGDPRDARDLFAQAHVPGARFFDIDAIADHATGLPHMAPGAAVFAAALRDFGIGPGDQVVVCDAQGMFSAPRVWWTFRLMGWRDVAVLDGGMPKWRAEGRALAQGDPGPAMAGPADPAPDPALIRDRAQVMAALRDGSAQVLDARARDRFAGAAPEPRPGLRSGHMPGALNLPFAEVLAPDGTLKSPGELRATFTGAGIDLTRPVITTCGSGITAALLFLALVRAGAGEVALYDGSWAEWGLPSDFPVVKGAD
ncbi:MAG: 3-mercaptopyruvate sulfurtransferase [Rubellimicrobium sp.]|nr:3-mercaptopyruvate sulfurtransferase [Rubellimicrobium sp.]